MHHSLHLVWWCVFLVYQVVIPQDQEEVLENALQKPELQVCFNVFELV